MSPLEVALCTVASMLLLYTVASHNKKSGFSVTSSDGGGNSETAESKMFTGTVADFGKLQDYSEVTKMMGLEPEVAKSHMRFVNELPHRTTTASKETVLTSFNPPVQFYGLPRNALYKQTGASSNARTVPTETDSQAIDFALHRSSGYTI